MTEFLGLRRLDHIGLTVPDLDAAVDFFCNAFGFELLYAHGPYGDAESEWAEREFELHPRSIAERIAMLRLGALQLELFEWSSPDQDLRFPKATDAGGYHLAFYVDDVPAAVRHLRDNGAAVIGTVKLLPGPEA